MENKIYMEERQREIAAIIAREGSISTARIQGIYMISSETARRDLEHLEKSGLCIRTHGGAIAPLSDSGKSSVAANASLDASQQSIFPEYLEIARRAVTHIRENDHVYLTNGLIGHLMLRFLPTDIFYTVIVNSADMASELRAFGSFDTYVIGGKMRQSGSIVDSAALETVSCLKFDLCFLTGGGVSKDFGFSNGTGENAAFQRAVIKNSKKRVLLMPGNKIGHDSFVKVCNVSEFDEIVTDWNADSAALNMLSEAGVSVFTVKERR